jgi:hypothetical protein
MTKEGRLPGDAAVFMDARTKSAHDEGGLISLLRIVMAGLDPAISFPGPSGIDLNQCSPARLN